MGPQVDRHLHYRALRGVQERKGQRLFKELTAENFLKLQKETDVQLQEAKRVSNEMIHTSTLYNYIVKS